MAWIDYLVAVSIAAAPTRPMSADDLLKALESHRFVTIPAPCLSPGMLGEELARLSAAHQPDLRIDVIGHSFRGRDIRMITMGSGSKGILIWSQMHGDEPSATPALLDLADFLARERTEPRVAGILKAFTLRMIPMLNPDGAEAYERRNAQGIDINRDALMLATPEGRLLKAIRDRYEPILGFNLHDQGRRVTVGGTGVLSSISLLAVAGDEKGTLTPGRMRAKRVASHIVKVLSPFIPGGIARYDEDWNPRAFGDNLTAWGSPVVLIESGGFPQGGGFRELTQLNFVALVSLLDGLARNDLADSPPDIYDELLRNRSDAYADVALSGVSIFDPKSSKWFEADIAFDALTPDRMLSGCGATDRTGSRVVEVGDSRVVAAGRRVDGRGLLVVPLSRKANLEKGEITPEVLGANRPSVASGVDPRAFLSSLHLSETSLIRNGPATFLAFVPGATGKPGRYYVVIDGAGLPDTLH